MSACRKGMGVWTGFIRRRKEASPFVETTEDRMRDRQDLPAVARGYGRHAGLGKEMYLSRGERSSRLVETGEGKWGERETEGPKVFRLKAP